MEAPWKQISAQWASLALRRRRRMSGDWEVGDRVTRSRRLEGVKMISVRNNRIIVAEKRQKKWQRESEGEFQFLP